MANFTDEDIFRLDKKYAQEGVRFHARPFHAALEILGTRFSEGLGDNPEVEEVYRAYARLIPSVETTWPGMGVGLAASIDEVRKVTLGVTFGTASITIDKGLEFDSPAKWFKWCRNDCNIAARSAYAFADIHDLIMGIDYAQHDARPAARSLWTQATSNLEDVANSLSSSYISSSIIQSICLVAELAMKGSLYYSGMSEKAIKELNHRHKDIAKRLIAAYPHSEDELLIEAANRLPNYVATRYTDSGLTRLDLVGLALDVQFIAASSLRRVSDAGMAAEMEASGDFPGTRKHVFS